MNTTSTRMEALWATTCKAAFGLAAALGLGLAQAQVGMTAFQAGNIEVTLTYPTTAQARPVSQGAFTLEAAPDTAPREQRHRLVVLSHGTGGSAVADHALAAALARAGFVVAQPLHPGDNFRDSSRAGPPAFAQRPRDVLAVVDALGKDARWAPRLALDKVGVHGMSAGGVTGLSLSGAQWRTLNLVRHCQTHAQDDEGFCFNGAKEGAARAERKASFDRARNVPEWLLPSDLKAWHGGRTDATDPRPDARIAAVTLAVPVAAIYSAESLARIRIPVGVVSAQRDEVLVPRFHSGWVLAHCRSCTLLAELPGGHFDLLWPWPDSVTREVAAQQVRGGLPTPGFDPRLRTAAHERIVAFHRQHLQPLP